MTTEIRFELQRITRRRGSFLGCMGFAATIALVALVAGGDQTEDLWNSVLGIGLVMAGTIIGALAGSYDQGQGTMRYLVLTGTPRWRIVAVRVPALLLALLAVALPAALLAFIGLSTGGHADASVTARVIGGSVLLMLAWSLVSLTIGVMLRSNGAGIAAALVLFLAGFLVTEFVRDHISRVVGDHLLPNVANVVGSVGHQTPGNDPFTIGLGAASVTLVLWLVALLGLAIVRVNRDEY